MTDSPPARSGRPREFDRDNALQSALEMFWAKGYVGCTVAELQRAMGGITAPSFYAAFGSKEELLREVVDLYSSTEGAPMLRALEQDGTAEESIAALLHAATSSYCQPGRPRGCLVILGAINCTRADDPVQEFLREQRRRRHTMIKQRLHRGQADGDVSKTADTEMIASFFTTVLNGLAIEARDGMSRRRLHAIVDSAMAGWSALAKP